MLHQIADMRIGAIQLLSTYRYHRVTHRYDLDPMTETEGMLYLARYSHYYGNALQQHTSGITFFLYSPKATILTCTGIVPRHYTIVQYYIIRVIHKTIYRIYSFSNQGHSHRRWGRSSARTPLRDYTMDRGFHLLHCKNIVAIFPTSNLNKEATYYTIMLRWIWAVQIFWNIFVCHLKVAITAVKPLAQQEFRTFTTRHIYLVLLCRFAKVTDRLTG